MLIQENLTHQVIGAAIEVHKELGPGLLESAYQVCLADELNRREISFRQKVGLPVHYTGRTLEVGYEMDFLINNSIVIEIKSVLEMHPVFRAQLLTYMKLSQVPVGRLINFNVPILKDGIIRRVL